MDWLWYLVPIGAALCVAGGFGAVAWGIIRMVRSRQDD